MDKHWGETFSIIKFNYEKAQKLEEKYPNSETMRVLLSNNKKLFENVLLLLPKHFKGNTLGIEMKDVRREMKKHSADADSWLTLNYEGRNFLPSEATMQKIIAEENSASNQPLLDGDQIVFEELFGLKG